MMPDGATRNMILIDMPRENPSQLQSQWDLVNGLPFQSDSTIIFHEPKQWALKPDGKQCDICQCMIGDGDVVAVSYEYPKNFQEDILARKFKWRKVWRHLVCALPVDLFDIDFGFGHDAYSTVWSSNYDPNAFLTFSNFYLNGFGTNATSI